MKDTEGGKPAKVSLEGLRAHFRTTYRLGDSQIDIMLQSTAESLNKSLDALYKVLEQGGDLNQIARLGHGIKGLLLNMGEPQWAEIAREIELAAGRGEERDYLALVRCIHEGVEEVL